MIVPLPLTAVVGGAYGARMDSSPVTTVADYLASLPENRRAAIAAVRDVVNANLPQGYEEGMLYGMIGWYVPLSTKPDTYNGHPLAVANLGSQKNHMALYLMGVYGDKAIEAWFRAAFAAAGKKLDMGKSCVRFTSVDALPLSVIGETIAKVLPAALIATHDATHPKKAPAPKTPPPKTSSATKAPASKTASATKAPAKKARAK